MTSIWTYILVSVVSFLLGFIVELGVLRIRGRRIILPFISSTSRNFTIAAIALSVITLGTVINAAVTQDHIDQCNREVREALTYNVNISDQQRQLNDRASGISADRRKLLDKTFISIGEALGNPDRVRAIVTEYNTEARALSTEYEHLQEERAKLDQDRKPYPDPRCGR